MFLLSMPNMLFVCFSVVWKVKDMIRDKIIREKLGVVPIEDKMRESHLRWFGYV